jgi:hypothetical protein
MKYTIRYNCASVHVQGINEATAGSEFNYALSACPALSRSGIRMAMGESFDDVAEALRSAQINARVYGRKLCSKCEQAARRVVDEK